MRILQVIPSLKKNGTETAIMNVLRAIDRNNFQFDFLIFRDTKDGYYEEARSLGAKIFFIPPRKKNPFAFRKRLDRFFEEHGADYNAIQINDMSATSLSPLLSAKCHKIPMRILQFHGSNCEGLHNKLLHRINKHFIKNAATHYLGCSESAVRWGFTKEIISEKALVINNGINLDNFKFNIENRKRIREILKLEEEDDVLIHIGSFNKVKNHCFLLEIFSLALRKDPRLKLLLIGDGPYETIVREHSKKLGIEGCVFFLGRQDDIPSYLSAADCMILPSLHEGLPMTLIEAQAAGLPVIVSTGVSEESKASDKFKRLSLGENKEEWAKTIVDFMDLKKSSRQMDEQLERFSIINTVKKFEEIYSQKD